MPDDGTPCRTCRTCGIAKPETQFYGVGKHRPGILRTSCKACDEAYKRTKRQADPVANAAKAREYNRRYEAKYPEKVRASRAARWVRWAEANREHLAAEQRGRYDADPALKAASLEKLREWRQANPSVVASAGRRRRNVLRGMSCVDREYCEVLYADPCCYCGAPSAHVDHIIATSKGGTVGWENLTAACAGCNFAKSAQPFLSFMLSRK